MTEPPQRQPAPAETPIAEILGGVGRAVFACDPGGHVLLASDGAGEVAGLPPDALVGRPLWEIAGERDAPALRAAIERAVRDGAEVEVRAAFPEGPALRLSVLPSAAGLLVVAHPESASAAATPESLGATLALRERRFRAMIENALDLISILDPSGNVIYASPSHERVLGYRPEELVGRGVFELVHEEDRERILKAFAEGVTTPGRMATVEFRSRHRDGSWRVIEAIGNHPLGDPGIGGFVINSRDVTERRAAEDRTRVLLDVARDLATTLDADEILDRVQRRIAGVLPCDAVITYRWDETVEAFRLAAHFGLGEEAAARAAQLRFGRTEPFDGRLYEGPVVVNRASTQPGAIGKLAAQFGLEGIVASPLSVRGRYFGSLVVYRREPGQPFTERHVELCSAIASQVAVALERVELYRTEREAAEVFGALARIAQVLLASFDLPGLPDRLCRVTAEALGCESTHTLLLRPNEDAFEVVAAHGVAPDELDALRLVRIPRSAIGAALARVGDAGVAPLAEIPSPGAVGLPPLGGGEGAATGGPTIVLALRRGNEIVGAQLASRPAGEAGFSGSRMRIAQGLAHLASLALEHARITAELDAANRLKSEFVAMMSHELRTPLNAIIGYGDLLRDGAFGELSEAQAETMDRVQRSSHELLRLIGDLLDLSRLESGRLPLQLARVAIGDLLSDLEVELRHLERPGEVALVFSMPSELAPIHSDGAKVKVVLRNLVTNALKFTDRGAVEVAAAAERGGIVIRVSDTGIGIPRDRLDLVFEPFRQVHAGTRRHGGVGLGLYIVRRIVDMLGGTVGVESEVGSGSTFRVWLPAGYAAAPAGAAAAGLRER